jgi:streptogramin lyase
LSLWIALSIVLVIPVHAGSFLFLSDLSTSGVSQLDTSGNIVQQHSRPPGAGTGFGNGFDNPTGLAVDQNGVVYVADISTDSLNGEIYRFDGTTGAYLDQFVSSGALANPSGMTFGPSGDLYVANAGYDSNGFISVFDPSGALVTTFGSATGPGFLGLWYPHSVVFGPDGDLYVSDGLNGVVRFSAAGAFLGVFVPLGSGPDTPANLSNPAGLAFDQSGNLYVADETLSVVDEFSSAGVFLGTFVPTSSSLDQPTGMAFGPDSKLYIANAGQISQADGSTVQQFVSYPLVISPDYVAFASSVPEPGTFALFALGIGCLGAGLRRRP